MKRLTAILILWATASGALVGMKYWQSKATTQRFVSITEETNFQAQSNDSYYVTIPPVTEWLVSRQWFCTDTNGQVYDVEIGFAPDGNIKWRVVSMKAQ